jgi:hypothetical protein
MIESNKTYGFTIAVKELKETVPNIFRYASAYMRNNNLTSKGLWEMFVEPQPEKELDDLSDDVFKSDLPEDVLRGDPNRNRKVEIDSDAMEGEKYNMCHFWSNFEIAKLSFFRSKEYEDFFQTMDRSGGFWMERVCATPFNPNCEDVSADMLCCSGAMHPSTPSQQARCLRQGTSTTSAILGTGTRPFNTVLPMRPACGNCRASHTSRPQQRTSGSASRRTSTGTTGTHPRRMAWAADVDATPTSWTSRARRVVA